MPAPGRSRRWRRDRRTAASSRARAGSARSTRTGRAGSPGRRGPTRAAPARPVTRSTASITSRTECGVPVPRLYARRRPRRAPALERQHVRVGQVGRRGCSRAGRCRPASGSRRRRPCSGRSRGRVDRARDEVDLRVVVLAEHAVRSAPAALK